jgi:hypothetical protein
MPHRNARHPLSAIGVKVRRFVKTGSLALLAWSCSSDPGQAVLQSVRDSAGTRLVESRAASWNEEDAWNIAAEPVLDLGVVEGDSAFEFQIVYGVTRLSDGRLVVADAGSGELRCFDREGNHLWSTGRLGEGPGEYRVLYWVKRLGNDSLIAYDRSLRRVSYYDTNGAFARTVSLETYSGAYRPNASGVQLDGSIVVLANASINRSTVSEGVNQATGWLLKYSADGTLSDTIAPALGEEWVADSRGARPTLLPRPFGTRSFVAVSPNFTYLGVSNSFEIAGYAADGSMETLIRLMRPKSPVTSELIDIYKRTQFDRIENDEELRSYRRLLDDAPYPEFLPAFSSLMVDADDNLWVGKYLIPGERQPSFFVFGLGGGLLGTVDAPPGLRIVEIGSDYVIGVWRDEVDVEHVRVYVLRKP